jgi:outer membrane protein OmpA-like peptidoglycan-associated protein
MRFQGAVAVAIAVVGLVHVTAQAQYSGAWDPAADAAAEAAVARLGSHRALEIPGLAGGLVGRTGILATVQEVRQALQDLKAKETASELQVDLPSDILFDFDSADIRTEAESSLAKVVTVLGGYRGSQVTIEGHTDGKGTPSYNQALSDRRAASVRAWLEAHGARDVQMQTRGLGATQPVASNAHADGSDNAEGRQKNRRVRIIIKKAA